MAAPESVRMRRVRGPAIPACFLFVFLPLSVYADDPAPVALCEINDPRLNEVSGIVESRRHRGRYYIHNDSGDSARVFVIDRTGRVVCEIRLDGAEHVDWEDIAIATSASGGGHDVCVGDIGDNWASRPFVTLYRFAEPESIEEKTLHVRPTVHRVRYESGPVNAEALVVHPHTGDAYLFTKRADGRSEVFRLPAPWTTDSAPTLVRKVAMLSFEPAGMHTIVTGADLSPDGRRLVTRSYTCGWEWRLPDQSRAGADADHFHVIFHQPPRRLDLAIERQGEAVAYAADGKAILTISEGAPTTLFELRR